MKTKLLYLAVVVFALNIASDGHGKSKAWMIKTLSTAAPSFIGDFASVATYDGKMLREGTILMPHVQILKALNGLKVM